MYNTVFTTADEAFQELYPLINRQAVSPNGTKRITNVGIKILFPHENKINTPYRSWSITYAKREFDWYLSKDRSVANIKKYAKIWDNMHSGDNIVNSNYGYQWNRNNQLQKVIQQLTIDPNTRQAWLTIFDGKEKDVYKYDTPCTLSIGFTIDEGLLCMTVLMRSNDLWFGFCNDQYCFSELQKLVAKELHLNIGWYYHYAQDMHLYNNHFFIE